MSNLMLIGAAFVAIAWTGFLIYARATGMIGYTIAQRSDDPIDYDEMQRELDEEFRPLSVEQGARLQ